MNKLKSIYHGDHRLRTQKELVRSYLTVTRDLGRVMTRVKRGLWVLQTPWFESESQLVS